MPEPIGICGCGLLGSAIAERLLVSGFPVHGYDLDRARYTVFPGQPAPSLAALLDTCPRILLALPDSRATASLFDSLASAYTIIDCTTGNPEEMAAFATRHARYIDACVVGSSRQVRAGEAVLLCGGDAALIDGCRDVFDTFAETTFHVGPSGAGARLKLVVNLVLGLNRAALAEGLAFAERQGVDAALAISVLKASAAYSRVMDTKGPRMLLADYHPPDARLKQHLKDVRLIREAAPDLPFSATHEDVLARAVELGWAEADNAAIIEALRSTPQNERQ